MPVNWVARSHCDPPQGSAAVAPARRVAPVATAAAGVPKWGPPLFRLRLFVLLMGALGTCGRLADAAEKHYGIPQVRFIDERIAAGWVDAGLQPAAAATDEEWCRRVHLDLVGRIPAIDELQAFLSAPADTRREELVDRLLGDEMVDDYARNWTDIWTTVLIGRDTENERVNRSGMRQWLRRVLAKNIPFDEFATELITATGVSKSGQKGFNGATNFLAGKLEENGVQATAKTAQVFLGLQVQCTQCHNHPFNKGKQNQFWEFNAFFRQTRALRRFGGTRDIQAMELIDEDFAGEGGGSAEEAPLFYELRNGQVKVAFPVFVDGTAISKSGYLPAALEDGTRYGVHRRQELAKLIVSSPLFAKALVNRIWAHFFGFGFTRPIDDLGEHNPPSHPELFDGLADRFRESSLDVKALMRWIVLSRPYALSSRASKGNAKDDPFVGEPPRFARFYLRQMRPEELYQSLLTATEADRVAADGEAPAERGEAAARRKDEWLSQFIIAFGTDEGDEATTFNGSIPQVLMMFNGDLVKAATAVGKGGFLDRVAGSGEKNAAKIDLLYLAALARRPSAREVKVANQMMAARKGDAAAALQDIWWAVLNCNEFILNH